MPYRISSNSYSPLRKTNVKDYLALEKLLLSSPKLHGFDETLERLNISFA